MFGTIYKSYSGLLANSQALNITSNNLANASTVGFKRSSVNFSQLMNGQNMATSGNGNPIQFGLGAMTTSISPHFSQGSIAQTGISTNLALLGDGFFVTSFNGSTQYTRAGNFGFNQDGILLGPNGAHVQGYTTRGTDGTIQTGGAIGDIIVDFREASPPQPTSLFRLTANLSATAVPGETFSATINVWDANGNEHPVRANFVKSETDGEWTYSFDSPESGLSFTDSSGSLTFDSAGHLATLDGQAIGDAAVTNRTITVTGSDFDLAMNWDLTSSDANGVVSASLSNFGDHSSQATNYQDGFGSGSLQTVDFRPDGTMLGTYTNGATVELARVALARFNNYDGLQQTGGGAFRPTAASGEPILDTSARTSVLGKAVEISNVDIAEELVSMIVSQRGFQGNSKAISTSDQVLQEILNLKR